MIEITKRKQLSASLRRQLPTPSGHPVEISHMLPDPTTTIKKFMGWNVYSFSGISKIFKDIYKDYDFSSFLIKDNPFLKMINKTEKP